MRNKPIGIFDSGIGGLTVAKEIVKHLPNESIIYLGDTARVPYGTRGIEVITNFALEIANYLVKQDVKFLVVACNTISATCLDKIQNMSPVPVIGVIKPAVLKIIESTKINKIGIIGTRATINSKAYEVEIHKIDSSIKIITKACPLFVPITEEGLADSNIAKLAAEEYLSGFINSGIDTLHLGCTHYPLLYNTIKEILGENINIIDAATPTALELKRLLNEQNLTSNENAASHKFYFTDAPERVIEAASLFFGENLIDSIEKINLPHS